MLRASSFLNLAKGLHIYATSVFEVTGFQLTAATISIKTVRVTAGLQRGIGPLKRAFTHRQWPRFTEYTRHFCLALGCVFVKQSDPPCHCDLLIAEQARLVPKIRRQFSGNFFRQVFFLVKVFLFLKEKSSCRIPWAGLSRTPSPSRRGEPVSV